MTVTWQGLLMLLAGGTAQLLLGHPLHRQRKVLIDDSRVRVVSANIPGNTAYTVQADTRNGAIWVVINGSALTIIDDKGGETRDLSPSDTAKLEPGQAVEFRNKGNDTACVVVVDIKNTAGAIVPQSVDLTAGNELEEHTPDQGVLLVAVSTLKLQEIMQRGEADDPTPGNPRIINVNQGDARWLESGMRTLTNLLGSPVRFIWIGW